MNKTKVVTCACSNTDYFSDLSQEKLYEELSSVSIDLIKVNDLCGLFISSPETVKKLFAGDHVYLISCFERSMKWIAKYSDLGDTIKNVQVLNSRVMKIDDIVKCITGQVTEGDASVEEISYEEDWDPWFPVIDYDRCVECKQCLNFCLFGVYGTDEDGKIKVLKPKNCKNQCPACSRICPEGAIIFPKYGEEPINGAEVKPEHLKSDTMGVDLKEALDGKDLYSALRERRAKKPGLLKKEIYEQALKERAACSCECGAEGSCLTDNSVKEKVETADSCDCDCDCETKCCDTCDCDCDCDSSTGCC